jgi:hypothetical protein
LSTLFHFRFHSENEKRDAALVIFCPQESIVEQDLWDAINEDVGRNLRPDVVYFVVRDDCIDRVHGDLQTLAAMPSQWRIDPTVVPMGILAFNKRGQYAKSAELGPASLNLSKATFDGIKRQGVLTIFVNRNGLLRPGKAVHYIHPSGRHSQGFMRAANVLIHGPEVTFLAMCLLHHLDDCRHYLWIDTSSIASVPYAMIALRQAMEPGCAIPTVNSFSSYECLETTKFERKEGSVVLISASTSGKLARRMIEKGFVPESVVTLFSLASNPSGLSILCNLTEEQAVNPRGELSATEEFSPANCPMCQEGSKPVRFVGDQFLADAIAYEPYTIVATDAPKGLSALMKKYAGKSVFHVKAAQENDDAPNEIWIDVVALCGQGDFQKAFTQMADRYVPLSTKLIVHLGDEGCKRLAEIIRDRLAGLTPNPPEIVTAKEMTTATSTTRSGSVVIVAGCIGSGTELQNISRDLRDLFADQPRVYLSPFAKFSHTERYRTLKSDLDYNGPGLKHEVAVLDLLVLPLLPSVSAWTRENSLVRKWIENIEAEQVPASPETITKLRQRLETLSDLTAGNANGLFWPTSGGHQLILRQTFAFWPTFTYEDRTTSQADVFVTIGSVLENLRIGPKPKLHHTSFYHTLLSPACFGRFNDGVIQSSLLRAALPQELNYGAAAAVSEDMANLVSSVLRNWNNARGEACMEFLIALASKRMTLAPEHLLSILNVPPDAPPLLADLIKYCRHVLKP